MKQRTEEAATVELVERAQAGDRQALETLVETYYTAFYRLALRYCGNPEAARDAVQDACIQVMKNFDQLRDPRRFKPWMNRIVINCVRLSQRRNKRFVDLGEGLERTNADDAPSADEVLESQEKLTLVDDFLRGGGSDEMDIFHRLYVRGDKMATISRDTGVSVAAVKTRVHRARKRLRDYLGNQYGQTAAFESVAV